MKTMYCSKCNSELKLIIDHWRCNNHDCPNINIPVRVVEENESYIELEICDTPETNIVKETLGEELIKHRFTNFSNYHLQHDHDTNKYVPLYQVKKLINKLRELDAENKTLLNSIEEAVADLQSSAKPFDNACMTLKELLK